MSRPANQPSDQPASQYLSGCARPLTSGRCLRLHSYNITNESTVQQMVPLFGGLLIKVKTLTGKEIEIDIEAKDTIEHIKVRTRELPACDAVYAFTRVAADAGAYRGEGRHPACTAAPHLRWQAGTTDAPAHSQDGR